MAIASAKALQMLMDQSSVQEAVEGVQDEMMIALLNTMQEAATTCARICADRLNAFHSQMLRAFEEEARRQQSREAASLRGDCWEDLNATSTPVPVRTPERRPSGSEAPGSENGPSGGSERKASGTSLEQELAHTGAAMNERFGEPDLPSAARESGGQGEREQLEQRGAAGLATNQEFAATSLESSELGLSPAATSKFSASSPSVSFAPSARRPSNSGVEAVPTPGEASAQKRKSGSLARTAMQEGGSLAKTAMQSGGSLARSSLFGTATKLKRAANSAANTAASAANSAANTAASVANTTVLGRSPNASEKMAGMKEQHSPADEALPFTTAALQQPQNHHHDEWWGSSQPEGDTTSRSSAVNGRSPAQPGAGDEQQQQRGEEEKPTVQMFSLSEDTTSSEEEAC